MKKILLTSLILSLFLINITGCSSSSKSNDCGAYLLLSVLFLSPTLAQPNSDGSCGMPDSNYDSSGDEYYNFEELINSGKAYNSDYVLPAFRGREQYISEYNYIKEHFEYNVNDNIEKYEKSCAEGDSLMCTKYALQQIGLGNSQEGLNILYDTCHNKGDEQSCTVLGLNRLYGYQLLQYYLVLNFEKNSIPKDPTSALSTYISNLKLNEKYNVNSLNTEDSNNYDSINFVESKKIFSNLCTEQDTETSFIACGSLKEIDYVTSGKFDTLEDVDTFLLVINNYIQKPIYEKSFAKFKVVEGGKSESNSTGYYFRYLDYKVNEYIKNIYYNN